MPYSKRGHRSTFAVTRPPVHRTRRSTEEWLDTAVGCSASKRSTGIQSVISRSPSAVTNVVARTLVEGR